MSIENVYEIMKQLENESSRNAKEQILKDNKDNEEFREALEFLLNPYIVTGISTKKINKKIKYDKELMATPNTLSGILEYLKRFNSGRDYDILAIQNFINTLESKELKTFAKKLFTKSLRIGVSEKTANKVYGKDTIPTFAVMLAESYAKKSDKVKGKFFITEKLDGNRCVAIKENGITKFFTRSGKPIEGLSQIEKNFEAYQDNQAYDGELQLINENNLPSGELFRLTQEVVRKDGEKHNLLFHMFDSLPVLEFKAGKSKKTYEQRRNTLNLLEDTEFIKILPVLYEGTEKDVIPAYVSVIETQGGEGVMINTAEGKYETKRTTNLLKVKSFFSCDGVIMGVYEGTGKYESKLGGILITYKNEIVRIGSGFSDDERELYWKNPDSIVGKIGEYQYFEESKNQNGGTDLRFATWKCLRNDKTVDDLNYE